MAAYTPDRGHFVWIDFTPQAGREQAGHRPALVLSAATYNARSGLVVVCPVTSQAKGYAFEVEIPAECSVRGFVLVDAVKNLDWRVRGIRYAGDASFDLMKAVTGRLAVLTGVDIYWPREAS